jgi:hypothetical protein
MIFAIIAIIIILFFPHLLERIFKRSKDTTIPGHDRVHCVKQGHECVTCSNRFLSKTMLPCLKCDIKCFWQPITGPVKKGYDGNTKKIINKRNNGVQVPSESKAAEAEFNADPNLDKGR